ncbi:MAG: helix-turn-helix transcriptional regulator [Planctomycetota bacterium]
MEIERLTPAPAVLAELGRRLEQVRRQRGLSQEQLAEEAGIGVATLRRIEDGNDSRLGSWLRLLKALEMTHAIDALLPEDLRSPMADARAAATTRRRRTKRDGSEGFAWGDERP